jgi:hypothetical protein
MNDLDTRPEKDPAINELLDCLHDRLGPDAFVLVDHWESDPCAVGIASPRDHGVLAYVSTFGQPPGRYDVEMELPPALGQDFPYRDAGRHADVDFETLTELIRRHLSIPSLLS